MSDAIAKLKTDSSLVKALEKAASGRRPTAGELFEQRVSFIYGAMKTNSGITRDHIKQILQEQEGT